MSKARGKAQRCNVSAPVPIYFPRADRAELANFDPSTKVCTMNCGRHIDDQRSPEECKLLCTDCIEA